jgi:hypothetical protein
MPWLIALNVLLYIAAAAVFLFTIQWIIALILFILAGVLSLMLSGGSFNPFEIFD